MTLPYNGFSEPCVNNNRGYRFESDWLQNEQSKGRVILSERQRVEGSCGQRPHIVPAAQRFFASFRMTHGAVVLFHRFAD